MKRIIVSENAIPILCRAFGLDADRTGRIVIDVRPQEPVVVYAQLYADETALEVLQTLDGVEIRDQDGAL